MQLLSGRLAFVGQAMFPCCFYPSASRSMSLLSSSATVSRITGTGRTLQSLTPTTTCNTFNTACRLSSSFVPPPSIQTIGLDDMKEIVLDYEMGGRDESLYVILDVREPHEVAMTGPLSPHTLHLPLASKIMTQDVFGMDPDDFQDEFGFPKPTTDETLVFSCAAGVRSYQAAIMASQHNYTNLVNYQGGAMEWFRVYPQGFTAADQSDGTGE
eukprot:Nitzschia sp. Nitz4//scaffold160_size51814//30220//30858//NITZ4_006913-RA/size51814-processed-gene-0.25-mRNA-1//-1//CDS//3329537854//3115//frame0